MIPPLCIFGPTGVGKSALLDALLPVLQDSFFPEGVDVLVIDSKQVFRHETIVTGKDLPSHARYMRGKDHNPAHYLVDRTRIFGIDLVNPDEEWSLGQFIPYAHKVLVTNKQDNRALLVTCGTPLYLRSLLHPPATYAIPRNETLRQSAARKSLQELQEELASVDAARFESMNSSDRQNPRRLIRALEVATHKNAYGDQQIDHTPVFPNHYSIGLHCGEKEHRARIEKRVRDRIEDGAIDEYLFLLQTYPNWSQEARAAIGYELIGNVVSGQLPVGELSASWANQEYQYAKEQYDWWKKDASIVWKDVTAPVTHSLVQEIKAWYSSQRK